MEETKNQIFMLALSYCSDSKADTPEEMLFGLAKLSSLSDMALGYLLKDKGIEDTEEIRNGVKEIRTALKERKLDVELIKEGLNQLLPLIEQADRDTDKFKTAMDSYDEKTSVHTMVQDVVSAIDPEELMAFSLGKDKKSIYEYSSSLRKKLEESESQGSAEAAKQTTSGKSEQSDKDEQKTDEEPEEMEIYSDKLKRYIENLKAIIPAFVQAGNQELLWRQSLVVSIDDGFGFSTFLKQLEAAFKKNDLIGSQNGKSIINEMRFVNSKEEYEHSFDNPITEIEEKVLKYGDIADRKKLYSILAIDLSSVCGRMNTPKVREFLRCVDNNCDSVFVVFRIPYLDRVIVSDIEAVISDILAAKTLIVPPVTIPCMLDYMHKRAEGFGYQFEDGCDDYLEQGIITEKNDGRFYGFRTLNKIVDTVVYDIVSDSVKNNKADKMITTKQLEKYIDTDVKTADYEKMLGQMIGVDGIIKDIDKAINQVKVSQQLAEKGSEVERPSIHMLFRGNPGTGKTTIARIVASKMKAAGILKKGYFFEIKGRDLCGAYVGQTTPKTSRICREAYGSVLFIDEAYELYRGNDSHDHDYGKEALAALVAEIENHRDDMCVIFAGYTEEMDTMVTGNPGLKSRIPIVIDFPNYTKEQLEEIFFKMMEGKFDYEPGVKKCAHEFFDSLGDDVLESKEFSNARFVRNLFESVWGEAAVRYDLSEENKLIIREGDFKTAAAKADPESMAEKKTRPIGFEV